MFSGSPPKADTDLRSGHRPAGHWVHDGRSTAAERSIVIRVDEAPANTKNWTHGSNFSYLPAPRRRESRSIVRPRSTVHRGPNVPLADARIANRCPLSGANRKTFAVGAIQRGCSVEDGQVLRLGNGDRGHRTAPKLHHDANHVMSSEPCSS